jgi:hypothetical protein
MEQKRRNSMSKFFHPHLSRRKKQIKEKKKLLPKRYCFAQPHRRAQPPFAATLLLFIHLLLKKIRYSR